jgi:hypothetical protein
MIIKKTKALAMIAYCLVLEATLLIAFTMVISPKNTNNDHNNGSIIITNNKSITINISPF